MPNPMDIITQIQSFLTLQYETKDKDDFVDVPYVDDDEYRTHSTYGEAEELEEQDKDEDEEETGLLGAETTDPDTAPEIPPEGATTPGEEELAGAEAGGEIGGDLAGGEMGGDMGIDTGMPGEQEPLSPKQIGRAYEMKKIYSRLAALEKYLTDASEPHLVELRKYVTNGVELFQTVTANFESYKDNLDEIVVSFYKFLIEAHQILKKYYKKQVEEE